MIKVESVEHALHLINESWGYWKNKFPNLQENKLLKQDVELLKKIKYLPGHNTKPFLILILIYQTPRTLEELAVYGLPQAAAQCQELRRYGFIFRESHSRGKNDYTYYDDGKRLRCIIDYDCTKITIDDNQGGSFLVIKAVQNVGECVFQGIRKSIQSDHRIGRDAHAKQGLPFKGPTLSEVEHGTYFNRFQFLGAKPNSWKREICKKCMNGEEIITPQIFLREAYIRHYGELGLPNGCEGCYLYNYSLPKPEYRGMDYFVKLRKQKEESESRDIESLRDEIKRLKKTKKGKINDPKQKRLGEGEWIT